MNGFSGLEQGAENHAEAPKSLTHLIGRIESGRKTAQMAFNFGYPTSRKVRGSPFLFLKARPKRL